MSRKTIFRVFILLFFSIGGQMSANAQTTTPFETVFDACKKACEALDGGFASGEQLLAVSKTLRDAAPIPLTVKQTKGDVLSLKGHLVFDYEFIQACVDNETIYEIADKYAAEARMRGDKDSANIVRLDTKMVAAGHFRDSELFGNLADRLCGRGESLFQLENKDNRLSIEK